MSLKQEVENFLDHMRPFDGVLDCSNKTKYMNHRNTTNKNIGFSNSNDRNKIIHTSKGLKNLNHMKVRQESNNTVTNNFSSPNNNVKAHLTDNSQKSDLYHKVKDIIQVQDIIDIIEVIQVIELLELLEVNHN